MRLLEAPVSPAQREISQEAQAATEQRGGIPDASAVSVEREPTHEASEEMSSEAAQSPELIMAKDPISFQEDPETPEETHLESPELIIAQDTYPEDPEAPEAATDPDTLANLEYLEAQVNSDDPEEFDRIMER
jgi:hypothetical protein